MRDLSLEQEIKTFLQKELAERDRFFGFLVSKRWWRKRGKLSYYDYLQQRVKEEGLKNIIECCYLILHGLDKPPVCGCGYRRKFYGLALGYSKYCCRKDCFYKKEKVLEQIKNTCLRKYGVDSVFKSDVVKEKIKRTVQEKYGVDNVFKSEKVKQKIREANLKKYGVDNPMKCFEVRAKMIETCRTKYGKDYVTQTEVWKEKVKEVLREKYGVDNISKLEVVKEKKKQTFLKRYGVDNISYLHFKNFEDFNLDFILNNFVDKDGFFELQKACEYFNCSKSVFYGKNSKFYGKLPPAKREFGLYESEVYSYLRSLDSSATILKNVRNILSGYKELDIFLPDYRIAIEFDGLMWHSFGMSDYSVFNNYSDESYEKYHLLEKTKECESLNIRLFHIFENEWLFKKDIWKSILASALNKSKKIYARDCEVREVNKELAVEFLEKNHLQGSVFCKVNLGLFLNESLVCLLCLNKPRFNKTYEWEIVRFCNKLFTSVVGGFSKLFAYFVKYFDPKSVISYVDRRYGIGSVYLKNGFKFLKETRPNYYYFLPREGILYHRIHFQKHKLPSKLEVFDFSLTETENMYLNGYRKIYDCGNLVYVWNRSF